MGNIYKYVKSVDFYTVLCYNMRERMITMKKIFLTLFALAFIFISACSQSEPRSAELLSFIDDSADLMGDVQRAARFTADFSTDFTYDGDTVSTEENLKYSVSGGEISENGISSDGELLLSLEDFSSEPFNRYRFYYFSDNALKCTVKYTVDGSVVEDSVFLEAGTDVFTCLILGFLENDKAVSLNEIVVNSCNGEPFNFLLCKVETEVYEVLSDKDYVIENDRYKLGIRLIWGGGINYIVDKSSYIYEVENLVNQSDTGRLIQQSYYGSDAQPRYADASFMDSGWRYNPVQGGDQYNNHSRLIDFVETEHSVYIKSQPQDWSLDGMITSSYMENVYTVYDVCIRVENRFVDFTCWEHPIHGQELPAFYTLSYFDKFVYYSGEKPWTGDDLTVKADLEFWGDPLYSADCRFEMKEQNTETWCAWYNEDEDYGIGLYVPNISVLYAGRYKYDGSKDPEASSTSYVAPLNTFQMVSLEPIEYEYLITTGSVDGIREIFTANKDFTDNSYFNDK